jgi:membrane peptidoglycan carboxypeptidase
MLNVHGIKVAGGTFPAEIWGQFMREATKGKKVGQFKKAKKPANLEKFVPGWCNSEDIEVLTGPKNYNCSSTKEDGIKLGDDGTIKVPVKPKAEAKPAEPTSTEPTASEIAESESAESERAE